MDSVPPLACLGLGLKPMNLSRTQTATDFEADQQTPTLDGT